MSQKKNVKPQKKGLNEGVWVAIIMSVMVVALIVVMVIVFNMPDQTVTPPTTTPVTEPETMNAYTTEVFAGINSHKTTDFVETDEKTDYVKITVKDHGDIIIHLLEDTAPITVKNFKKLVSESYYDGTIFHRVMKDFMIQGGDGAEVDSIKGEFSSNGVKNDLNHIRGVISMARTDVKDSASSQFFICDANSSFLDGNYAAFGYVIAGLGTVDSVANVEVTYKGSTEKSSPVEDVVIEKVCFVKDTHNH